MSYQNCLKCIHCRKWEGFPPECRNTDLVGTWFDNTDGTENINIRSCSQVRDLSGVCKGYQAELPDLSAIFGLLILSLGIYFGIRILSWLGIFKLFFG